MQNSSPLRVKSKRDIEERLRVEQFVRCFLFQGNATLSQPHVYRRINASEIATKIQTNESTKCIWFRFQNGQK